MKLSAKFVMSGTALLMLGGCQGVLAKIGLGGNRSVDSRAMASASDGTRLELGLAALRSGSPGNAIYHFERAILDPTLAPEAYNGMGVAYAKLGREDLSERFFNVAIMMKPGDARFARNLDRLFQSDIAQSARAAATKKAKTQELVAAATQAAEAQGLISAPSPDFVRQGAVTIDRRKTLHRRAANGEILIGGAMADQQANVAAVEVATRTEREQSSPADVEIETRRPSRVQPATKTEVSMIEGPLAANFEMPDFCLVAAKELEKRQELAAKKSAKKTVEFPKSSQSYPIRVAFGTD